MGNGDDPLIREQLGYCHKLLAYNVALCSKWKEYGGRRIQPDADTLILLLHARSTRTYEAIVRHLGVVGFAEQGEMLTRALFEEMVDAHWISLNRELAARRFREHERYSKHTKAGVQRRFPEFFEGWEPVSRLDKAEAARLTRLFGSGSWTGLSLDKRVQRILRCWPTEDDQRHVQFIYNWVVLHLNETLHPSSFSIPAFFDKGQSGAPEFRFGSTDEDLPRTLFAAFWTYGQTVGLLIQEFDLTTRDEFHREIFEPGVASFRSVAAGGPAARQAP